MTTKIIVCYHKESEIFESECLLPLHVGKKNSSVELKMQADNTGDNISNKNSSFCELTGMYWLWKNVQADNYGLFHYRRILDVENRYKGFVYPSKIKPSNFNNAIFDKLMADNDILLPQKCKIGMTIYDEYKQDHHIKDLEVVIKIINDKYPEYNQAAQEFLNSSEASFCNMFVMKKELFNEYCEWLFDILFEAEKIIDISDYDSYQKRIFGFLSERLFNIFVRHKMMSDKNIKVKEVKQLFLNPNPLVKIYFLIGKYLEFDNRIYLNILGFKFSKKRKING